MTERLYYTDAYTTRFKAKIVERFEIDNRLAVVLDQTCFYPTSGGQPADEGHLSGAAVLDVLVREKDGAVVHVVDGEIWSDEVTGEINWERRFDHMQQHTGQHILSQAFLQLADADTVGFHLGRESVTIDLPAHKLSGAQVEQAETLANQIIWENRPVSATFATPAEVAAGLPLRKPAAATAGPLRLVAIDQFDLSACGGTHVRHTGEVGLIKIIKLDRRGELVRIDFRCGRRALLDYRLKNSVSNRLAAQLTTGITELEASVNHLQDELKTARRLVKQQQVNLLQLEATHLLEKATAQGNVTIVNHLFTNRQTADVRTLANLLIKQPGVIVLLGVLGSNVQLIFARSDDAPGNMNQLIKPALQLLGSAGGGGTAAFAQGGGPLTEGERVQAALTRAERLLLAQIR
jgi:alanyl-tRNA synthetase